jgi:hypothetical protein
MSVSSISSYLPPVYQPPQQVNSVQKQATQNAQPLPSDSDGDSDGSTGSSVPNSSNSAPGVGTKLDITA